MDRPDGTAERRKSFIPIDDTRFFGLIDDREGFCNQSDSIDQLVNVVRSAFGSAMKEQDVIDHVLHPDHVYLLFDKESLSGLFAYSDVPTARETYLFVDGVALAPNVQSNGLFGLLTKEAFPEREHIALKTQNPRMYRALANLCGEVFPSQTALGSARSASVADALGFTIDERSVIRGAYGRSLYGVVPHHHEVSPFFETVLALDYDRGDSVLCIGSGVRGSDQQTRRAASASCPAYAASPTRTG